MTPRDNVLTGRASGLASYGGVATTCLRRRAVLAFEGAVKRSRLRVAEEIGHFGDGERRRTQIHLRRLPPRIIAQPLEGRPAAREATLQRARRRRESSGNRVNRHLAGGGLHGEDTSHLVARVAGDRQTGENRGRLTFEPSPKHR